ncbi:hypothetical protein L873DRAFT_1798854, partial [Choiromyces venosus 120613-1]
LDSHPPSATSQPSLPPAETSSHNHSEVPTEPLSPAELRRFEELMVRRGRFLSDYERYSTCRKTFTACQKTVVVLKTRLLKRVACWTWL